VFSTPLVSVVVHILLIENWLVSCEELDFDDEIEELDEELEEELETDGVGRLIQFEEKLFEKELPVDWRLALAVSASEGLVRNLEMA